MEMAFPIHWSKRYPLLKDALIVFGTSILFSLCALISIPLPFTPIRIVLCAQVIILFSVLLGKKGSMATLTYLAMGAMGLPIFSGGGSGIAHLLGPSGGYLVGWAVASYIIGALSERMQEKTQAKVFGVMLLGNAVIYLFGLPHLALFVGVKKSLALGLYPFIAVDLFKLILVDRALKALKVFKQKTC